MLQYFSLLNHWMEARHWRQLSPEETRRRQVDRFRRVFEHARVHSPFYRRLYREAGVDQLVIREMTDIERVPEIDKSMLRAVPTQEIMTRPITPDLVPIKTSGSTGEPFVIYQTKAEQYTSHVRVFAMLWELGWRPWHRILLLWRLEPDAELEVEQELGILTRLRQSLGLFQRDIASIFTPMPEVVRWLDAHPDARVLWSTVGVATLLCEHLEQQGRSYRFGPVVVTSETLSQEQRARFENLLGGPVVSHYGLMECPTIGYSPDNTGMFRIQPHACMLELLNRRVENDRPLGDIVLTNLVNHTMPFIRYRTGDTAGVLDRPDEPAKMLGPILGRLDDVITLPGGGRFAHHHAYALFMDFSACSQYKFVQYPDGGLALRLCLAPGAAHDTTRADALARWRSRYPDVPLAVEFVDLMPVDAGTGKFKNIERLAEAAPGGQQ